MFNRAYDYKNENVRLSRPGDFSAKRIYTCSRCERDLPEIQFRAVGEARRASQTTMVLSLICRSCQKQRRGEWVAHPMYNIDLDRYWTKTLTRLSAGAWQRQILVGIDEDDIWSLWIAQNGCCAISGLELNWKAKGARGWSNKAHLAPSVDRIDSRGNYVLGNVQITAMVVNLMKGDLPQQSFIDMCSVIAGRNLSL